MCTYYYLHHHHIYPCTRDIEFIIHYVYCAAATLDETSQNQLACPNIADHAQQNGGPGVDFNNPCASGGCLASPDCSLGRCRLQELNGLWKCCRCGLGGNRYPCCHHPMRKSPDTLCYHQCCQDCEADGASRAGSGQPGRGTAGGRRESQVAI